MNGGQPAVVAATAEEMAKLLSQPAPPARVWHAGAHMEFALVPAGEFTMGLSEAEARQLHRQFGAELERYLAATPRHTRRLAAYYIGRYPVTQAQYHLFTGATGHPVPLAGQPWTRPYDWDPDQRCPPAGKQNHPVVSIRWEDAAAYCRWAGLQLPSEAQWEKAAGWDAAAGRSRIYPWGDEWEGRRCNCAEVIAGRELPGFAEWEAWWQAWLAVGLERQDHDTISPVGAFSPAGDSPHGCADMAGNVWEWCADWFQGYPGTRCQHGDFGATHRVLRGGSRYTRRCRLRAAYRDRQLPRRYGEGFRCCLGSG